MHSTYWNPFVICFPPFCFFSFVLLPLSVSLSSSRKTGSGWDHDADSRRPRPRLPMPHFSSTSNRQPWRVGQNPAAAACGASCLRTRRWSGWRPPASCSAAANSRWMCSTPWPSWRLGDDACGAAGGRGRWLVHARPRAHHREGTVDGQGVLREPVRPQCLHGVWTGLVGKNEDAMEKHHPWYRDDRWWAGGFADRDDRDDPGGQSNA
jgi:hypothetical protein